MKRGMVSQVFVFIFVLLIIILVLFYGIKSIALVKKDSDKVLLLTFVSDFREVVGEYYLFDVGSNKIVELSLPTQIERVCFANAGERVTTYVPGSLRLLVEGNKKNNLYVLPLDAFSSPAPDFDVSNLMVDPAENPLCFDVKGRLRVKIETVLVNNQIFVEVMRS